MLPIVMLLVMITIDFGRAFYGWITLNNMARVGANYAALHRDSWTTPGSPADRQEYLDLMAASADRLGCAVANPLPQPVFGPAITPGDPDAWATVGLTCDFSPVAPGIRQVLGNVIKINASSTFPITYGCIKDCGAVPAPTPPPPVDNCRNVPAIAGMSVKGARQAWVAAGFTGAFNPATGDDTRTIDTFVTTAPPGADTCTGMTAFFASSITATLVPLVTPPPTPTCVYIPNLIGMTVGDARTAWTAAGFTDPFTPPADPATDGDIVTTQTVTPAAAIGDCVEPPAVAVAVTYTSAPPPPPAAPCKVPSLVNTQSTAAMAAWGPAPGAGFTGALTFRHSNQLPYLIKTQTLVGGTYVGCGSSMEVDDR